MSAVGTVKRRADAADFSADEGTDFSALIRVIRVIRVTTC